MNEGLLICKLIPKFSATFRSDIFINTMYTELVTVYKYTYPDVNAKCMQIVYRLARVCINDSRV